MNLPTTVYAVDSTTLVALLIQAGVYTTQEANLVVNPGFGCHFNPPIPDSGWVSAAVFAPTDEAYALIREVFGSNINIANMPVEARFLGEALPEPAVTRRQLREALSDMTLLEAVEQAVAASDVKVQIWWQDSPHFLKSNEMVQAMATGLGVTPEALDLLWSLAASKA